jgi:hypothetical protein
LTVVRDPDRSPAGMYARRHGVQVEKNLFAPPYPFYPQAHTGADFDERCECDPCALAVRRRNAAADARAILLSLVHLQRFDLRELLRLQRLAAPNQPLPKKRSLSRVSQVSQRLLVAPEHGGFEKGPREWEHMFRAVELMGSVGAKPLGHALLVLYGSATTARRSQVTLSSTATFKGLLQPGQLLEDNVVVASGDGRHLEYGFWPAFEEGPVAVRSRQTDSPER